MLAMQGSQWDKAFKQLVLAEKQHAGHPLLALLRVRCAEHLPEMLTRAERIETLRRVAKEKTVGLTRMIGRPEFPWLSAEEHYELLQAMPKELRTAADLRALAVAALAAGKPEEALPHAEAALAAAGDKPPLEYETLRIDALLHLERIGDAVRAARARAERPETPPGEMAVMAELLARFGQREPADGLFARALGHKGLSEYERRSLLRRRADVNIGLARWRLLLQAALLPSTSADQRDLLVQTVLRELVSPLDAELAGVLAEETRDPAVRIKLLRRTRENDLPLIS